MDNNVGNRAIHNQRMSGYKRDIFHTNGYTFESPYYGGNVKRFMIGGDYYKGGQTVMYMASLIVCGVTVWAWINYLVCLLVAMIEQ